MLALWLNWNDVFQRSHPNSYLHFRGIYWARYWSQLSKEEEMNQIKSNCQRLEGVILELFNKNGWNFRRMIEL